MYLTALVTKWRNKGIRFVIEFPGLDKMELMVQMINKGWYISYKSNNFEDMCKVIDAELTTYMEKQVDNNNADAGKK